MQSSAAWVSLIRVHENQSSLRYSWSLFPCIADVVLLKSAAVAGGVQPDSFEFDDVADGGAPIDYDKNLLAGADGKGKLYVDFGEAEIETWQL